MSIELDQSGIISDIDTHLHPNGDTKKEREPKIYAYIIETGKPINTEMVISVMTEGNFHTPITFCEEITNAFTDEAMGKKIITQAYEVGTPNEIEDEEPQ